MNDGTVMAWGRNDVGQLGLGTTTGPETCMSGLPCSQTPVQVKGLSGVKAIATGYDHSLALLSDGTVVAWGKNQWGELGTGTTGPNVCGDGWLCNPTPTPLAGLSGVTEVATGYAQSLALLEDGTVEAWGSNNDGILGIGTATGPQSCGEVGVEGPCTVAPMAVQGLSGVTAIASGWLHNLALLEDGTVMAWGYNLSGQLGDGTNVDRDHPVAVSGLSGVKALAAGAYHSMALLSDGTVDAWGWNVLWSLGSLAAGEGSNLPLQVDGLAGATAIDAGYMNSYALGDPPATYPKVSSISPHSGPEEGGTAVTITGTGLGNVTSVKFGSTDAASFTIDSDTSITAISPPGTGTVGVTVEDARGPSYAGGGTYFRYGFEEVECMIPEGCGPGECMIEPWECQGGGSPEEPPVEGPGGVRPLLASTPPGEAPPGANSGALSSSSGGSTSTAQVQRRGVALNRRCNRKWARHHAKGAHKKHPRPRACRPGK